MHYELTILVDFCMDSLLNKVTIDKWRSAQKMLIHRVV